MIKLIDLIKEITLPIENYKGDLSQFDGFKNHNISDVLNKLNSNQKIDLKIGKVKVEGELAYLLLADDIIIAALSIDEKTGQVKSAETHSLLRGKGYADILYTSVNDDFYRNKKLHLKSDNLLSPDAIRFWDGLVRKGKAKVIGKSTVRNHNIYKMLE